VCTHPLAEKYAIFDIAESRFLAQNAPKSLVAGLCPDPQATFDGPTSKRGEGNGGE